jgi:hypothetical protein
MEHITKGNRFKERCLQICGDDSNPCFIGNNKQIDCISDMIINKVYAVKATVDRAREENQCEEIANFLGMASENVDELINWVKYLQGETKRK